MAKDQQDKGLDKVTDYAEDKKIDAGVSFRFLLPTSTPLLYTTYIFMIYTIGRQPC